MNFLFYRLQSKLNLKDTAVRIMESNQYDLISPIYDILSKVIFANRVFQSQLACLNCIDDGATILFIGGGTGKILNEILKIAPNSKIVYLEKSGQMIRRAKKKYPKAANIEFIKGNEDSIPNLKVDIVITFYFLDLFKSKKQHFIYKKINSKLKSNGIWLVTDFHPASNWWQRWIERIMFLFLKVSTKIDSSRIPDIKHLFKKSNFRPIQEKHFFSGYIFSSAFRKL